MKLMERDRGREREKEIEIERERDRERVRESESLVAYRSYYIVPNTVSFSSPF